MTKFVVLEEFADLQDNGYKYHTGDLFPRDGLEVSEDRIKELSTDKNRRKTPLIEIPKKALSKPKEEPQESETPESTTKTTKPKGRQRKV